MYVNTMAGDIWGLRSFLVLFFIVTSFSVDSQPENPHEESLEEHEVVSTTAPVFWEESLFFELIEPEDIAYVYKIRPAKNFGVALNFTLFDVELVPAIPADGCSTISNSLLIYGNIALVERGFCSFLTKAINAEEAGAKAVIIMDNNAANDDTLIEMVDDGTHRTTSISAFFLLGKDGFMIRQCLDRLELQQAVINIPLNITLGSGLPRSQPPWSIWS